MGNVLSELLTRVEILSDGVLTKRDVQAWPAVEVERLVSMGILDDGGSADVIEYDDCDHQCTIENTDFEEHPNEPGRFVCLHRCMHGCGLVLLEPADFTLWKFSLLGLAKVIARAINATGSIVEDISDRVVLVGTVEFRMETREIFLVTGLGRQDASAIISTSRRLRKSKAPFILSTGVMPQRRIWPEGMDPAIAVLAEHATLEPFGLELDLKPLLGLESIPHADADSPDWITNKEAAIRLQEVVSGLTLDKAESRVSRAGKRGLFRTNGVKGPGKLIENSSFMNWWMEQRAADLARDDEPEIVTRGTRYGKMAAGAPARRSID